MDVDIWSGDFTGTDTIYVTANNVGLFQLDSGGSYEVTPEIVVKPYDGDDYNPNWIGYLGDSYSIAAGASQSSEAAIGFQNWVITSTNTSDGLNILALGGDGSSTATTITVIDPPGGRAANTMLFATSISDSLSTDWQNLVKVDLSQTRGFETITGLETDIQGLTQCGFLNGITIDEAIAYYGSLSNALAVSFQYWEGGGLLSSDTSFLTTIIGGAGNSFYDLSSLIFTPTYAATWNFQGGSSHAGNSEIAFSNQVMTETWPFTTPSLNGGTTPINISHIQILDDVSATYNITVPTSGGTAILPDNGEAQGGVINMANFSTLEPLNVPYGLLAENLHPDGGTPAPIPFGLPYTVAQLLYTPPTEALPPTVSVSDAKDYQNGVVPAGFQLLQFLNADGSTQTVLGADLTVYDNFVNFAVNAQDLADGYDTFGIPLEFSVPTPAYTDAEGNEWYGFEGYIASLQGFNMTFYAFGNGATSVNTADTFTLFVSDDGAILFGCQQLLDVLSPAKGTPYRA